MFGIGNGAEPETVNYQAKKSEDDLDLLVTIQETKDALGYNILWGHEEGKLYHSYQIYRDVENLNKKETGLIEKRIGALVKGEHYFVRVDSFNENGITHGEVKLCSE